ncbi:HTH-type transcriptional activator HxlR [Streptomyces sp. MBT84]|uniref:winged helix-turn-helix transcriptional regulator n=1 Tax=unclassified Streptomyces TaxID=2593676 RepID=UPI001C6E9AB8|nr:winged helix-turn-helix transcriptional regulator [Streptomyces sp. MBT84]MBW8705453.1 HTH-type transcriptional activator HxlR [Streptomyces sp. MBT84]
MERDGLISRAVEPTVPPGVEYAPTPRSRSLYAVLAELVAWTEAHLGAIRRDRDDYETATRSSIGT